MPASRHPPLVPRPSGLSLIRIASREEAIVPLAVYGGRVEPWATTSRRWGNGLVVALIVGAPVEILIASSGQDVWLAVASLAWTLPLLARHRLPLATGLAVPVVIAVEATVASGLPEVWVGPRAAVIGALWTIGWRISGGSALAGLLVGIASWIVVERMIEGDIGAREIVFAAVLAGVPWLAGHSLRQREGEAARLRTRAARLELEQQARDAAAIADERTRVARELHDVLAHSIGVMTVQAGAARLLIDDAPGRAEESLRTVADTGRQALPELRRLLGVLGDGPPPGALSPHPGLGRLDALVDELRGVGLPVEVTVRGAPGELADGVDLAAYRIVQEALTNVLRHGGSAPTQVLVRHRPEAVELEVIDEGPGAPAGQTSAGHGLIGMRERALLYGGEFEAGNRAGGGFAVRARLPAGVEET
jgi:signal transduction histidine kinase